jgi:tetratricopeptide (TPR) repeat protein
MEVTCLFAAKLNKWLRTMLKPSVILSLLLSFTVTLLQARTVSSETGASSKTDSSKEASIIEQYSRKERFENDGTSSAEDAARVRIQSEAAVQQYGVLSFSYASAISTFEIVYVRVRKPDGSVVETPPENVQDMAAQITRQAPFYSDLHEKHVAVKGLSPGDVLEYRTQEHTTKPLAPGQFWTAFRFTTREQVVLDEQLEISVPRERVVKIKSMSLQPTISEAAGYRIYTWHNANPQRKDDSNQKREAIEQMWQQARGRLPQPDVLMSSFSNWEDVGRWYGGLQEERVKPTPEITAKAAELTKNATSDEAKMRALYGYVSTQFHYIGIAFGIGRYQPHAAAEVLANQYGDCKDKHTLLASLLTAAGIPAYPALISSSRQVVEDVPSPGQFDHVITVVPREDGLVWLDSTAEVGPYRFLIAPLRDKQALAVLKDKPALMITPQDLPYPTTQVFNMDATLNDAGTLVGNADFTMRGDLEFLLRTGFRAVALPQWKDLVQRISFASGFGGDVSEVTAGSPEKTDEPFHFSYKYTRKEFGDWSNRRILAPEPVIELPGSRDEELLPLGPSWLGPLTDIDFRSQVELPKEYRPELPAAIHLKRDFAQFDATYDFKDGKMLSERHLKTLMREVPVSEREEYKQFVKAVQDDYGTYIPLTGSSLGSSVVSGSKTSNLGPTEAMRNLPGSLNPEAARLESEARDQMSRNDLQGAVSSLYRAVGADPKFTRAWIMLGTVLMTQKQKDAGIEAFHKAMAADPGERAIPKVLGFGLMSSSQFEDAVPVWQEYIKAYPDDIDGPANLAICLRRLKRYSEAVSAYEAALKINGDRPNLQAGLASAYLEAGDREKAEAAFIKLGDMDKDSPTLNDAAYEMANADLKLPLALDYAGKAVRSIEEKSQKITLPELTLAQLTQTRQLAAYWDTLGWVNERASKLEDAELYLRASWKLMQDGVVAGHLCHMYRRTHKVELAIRMCQMAIYRMALATGVSLDQYKTDLDAAQENLKQLTGGSAQSKNAGDVSARTNREREFKLPRFLVGTESAEFFVLLASDGKSKAFKVEDVKFISGSDKMKLQGEQLKSIDFNAPAPDGVPTRFVWRGILGCYQYTGCSFVLLDPGSVHSLN